MTGNVSQQSLLALRPTGAMKFVLISMAAHVIFAGGALAYTAFFSKAPVQLDQVPIKASLVRLGKPRDEKLLPQKEEEPPPAPPKVEPVATPEAVAPTPPDTAIKIPTKDAKPEKNTPSKTDSKTQQKSLADAFGKMGKGPPKEMEGQADGDVDGDSAKQEGEKYYGLLNAVVRRYYDVSDSIPESERRTLKAVVVFFIADNGALQNVVLQTSSGNEIFDSAVLAAVRKAAPFTAPPEALRDGLKKQGVAMKFLP
jgi:TonB family protein